MSFLVYTLGLGLLVEALTKRQCIESDDDSHAEIESQVKEPNKLKKLVSEIGERIRNLGFGETMGGGHGGGITYKGVTVHTPKTWHTVTGKGLCAVMWFWILYRAKQDGPVVMGWRHPWDGHGDHGHGDHH